MILDDLVQATQENMRHRQVEIPLSILKTKVRELVIQKDFSFEKKLRQQSISVIAEIKQASPSKGQIIPQEQFDYLKIAHAYDEANVDLISVLTEEKHFKGSISILKAVAQTAKTPILRKDFIIDDYMIYEAIVAGATVILLIVAILEDEQLRRYLKLADELGLSAIVEAHNEKEIQRAIIAKARIIGINNRNLKDFSVDFNNTKRLRGMIPKDILVISESGIKTRADVVLLENIQVDGILVGETFMKSNDKIEMIKTLLGR
ncbi:indole-3-glycerol phosphate synthase TrpC [Leuconostoc inhae]|uniref:indole-3-glycerol phosphate synthase TrpC n=1 Tax=Leuconostoc inhae TaxID=178001 RepID=UPI001C7DD9E5|nr:indole-3-glycerol phosphate synthase TrpC [Leuconostoc inhae]